MTRGKNELIMRTYELELEFSQLFSETDSPHLKERLKSQMNSLRKFRNNLKGDSDD